MRSIAFKVAAVIAAAMRLWLGRFAWDYFDPNSPAFSFMQVQLKLFGDAMYELHANIGRWPSNLDDLAKTSLPAKSYVWRRNGDGV